VHEVLLPLNVDFGYPAAAVLAATALLVVATFFGLAALQTAAAMRLLDPQRHAPPAPPRRLERPGG
jgi:hypothetical protein